MISPPNRWRISSFYSFIRRRLNRVCLLRFSSQKVCWTRRDGSKNVPIFLKRNWIHKSVEGRRGRTRVHTGVHLAFLRKRFCVSKPKGCLTRGRKKKARVKAGDFIFYGIPGSPCPLSISLSRLIYSTSPSPSAFPQLKTFDFPRRSIITKKKKELFVPTNFCFSFSFLNAQQSTRGRENFVFVDWKKEISIGWKFYCFRKWRGSDESRRRRAPRRSLVAIIPIAKPDPNF